MCLSKRDSLIGRGNRCADGFTLIELMIAIAIIGLLVAVAVPGYQSFIDKGRAAESSALLMETQSQLEIYFAQHNSMPESLAELGVAPKDKWGNDFIYLPLDGYPENLAASRHDANTVLLNDDYDLWSPGKDGVSNRSILADVSEDDIIRAQNGRYFGLAKDY